MAKETKHSKQDMRNILLAESEEDTGTTQITPEVIEVIAQIATQEVSGVYSMRGKLSDKFTRLFGATARGKGVVLHQALQGLIIDAYVFLEYGVAVPKVALNIQSAIKSQIASMTDLTVTQVNVHVSGIIPDKRVSTIDPNNLFGEDDMGSKD
ncbi:Asp23/Gls24 family envelope stress response protein [Leuconostoc fallax]|uniref:Asp23/Gls24 family envelope stress response protein n=1 Tax=Leuconostoc fallax TaxID=1251 RepID=A0A4R5N7A3_9LACO|nr:Asp23/Gls24 family envelope stress response protein [Leuconostoc fallax]MBU7455209.1 Asp23/Gls24 family envelope stress response protein [Leuconostoc fallax]MCO6183484.1 Asp23/Gls24 family envelope stress response protein [Leuconostoc fallax]TDG67688.1 hypothetical protein C5L23_001487 [Leuconostoc fallax]